MKLNIQTKALVLFEETLHLKRFLDIVVQYCSISYICTHINYTISESYIT